MFLLFIYFFIFNFIFTVTTKAQDDDGDNSEPNAEELCDNRPGDEYFRLNTEGDCRDVVR